MLLVIFTLCVLAGGAALTLFLVTRGPLSGDRSHDFGDVLLENKNVTMTHEFQLTNRLAETVVIRAARPECGCVGAPSGAIVVAPGQTIVFPVTMRPPAGNKEVMIRLDLGDHGLMVLRVSATGHLPSRLSALPREITLQPGATANVTIGGFIYETDEQPPPPVVSAPSGLKATFSGWRLLFRPQNFVTAPVQYEGQLTLSHDANARIIDAEVSLTVPGTRSAVIRVNPVASSVAPGRASNSPHETSAAPATQRFDVGDE